MVTNTNTTAETQQLAEQLAQRFQQHGGIITLSGDLGAGKTTFVQGFAKGLGITQRITSPTFIVMRQYPIPNTQRILYHLDLYRIEENSNFEQLGLTEIFNDPNNIVLIEWPEKLSQNLPPNITTIKIKNLEKDEREIEIIS